MARLARWAWGDLAQSYSAPVRLHFRAIGWRVVDCPSAVCLEEACPDSVGSAASGAAGVGAPGGGIIVT